MAAALAKCNDGEPIGTLRWRGRTMSTTMFFWSVGMPRYCLSRIFVRSSFSCALSSLPAHVQTRLNPLPVGCTAQRMQPCHALLGLGMAVLRDEPSGGAAGLSRGDGRAYMASLRSASCCSFFGSTSRWNSNDALKTCRAGRCDAVVETSTRTLCRAVSVRRNEWFPHWHRHALVRIQARPRQVTQSSKPPRDQSCSVCVRSLRNWLEVPR